MNVLKFISVKLVFLLVLGILIGHFFDLNPPLLLTFTFISFTLLGFLFFKKQRHNSVWFGLLFGSTTILIGILSVTKAQSKNNVSHYINSDFVTANVWSVKIREVLKPNAFSDRYIGIVKEMGGMEKSGKIVLNISIDTSRVQLNIDDELFINTSLSSLKSPLNPHQFNYAAYLNGLGIQHQIYLNAANYIKKKSASKTIYGIAASFRNHIILKLKDAHFGKKELPVIQALLLGQRNNISDTLYDDYKNAGAVHILALSGLHIGVILLLLQFILKPLELLPKGKTIKLLVIIVLLWGFAFLAGFSASIIRAVTMFTFVGYALYLNRPTNMFNILALSMFFILLLNPMLLFQVGFQMSYAAVFAITWIYPLLQKLWLPKNLILQKGWQLLSVSIAAQLGVLPISLFYFHQFPGLFFVSNILIIPFLGLILGMGIVVIVLALFNSLPSIIVSVYNTIIQIMNTVIGWVAQQEVFIFKNISFDILQLIISYSIIISLILVFTKVSFKRMAMLLFGVIGLQFWSFYQNYTTGKTEKLMIFHQTRNTILLQQSGKLLHVITKHEARVERIVTNYAIAERISKIKHQSLKNAYQFKNEELLIIDSLGIYPVRHTAPKYVLLTQSPKVNLERLIDSIHPKAIIADGSNYKSDIDKWKKTCAKRKLPFHYTGEKGAYFFTH
ncbi:MAG: competence protein [Flavobacteriaceae bacterium]|nr:MAG: competence protein [Flavobacteriaceae bacterium]